ncbi:MAG: type II toxin-antitoxin system RelE/ParE family toxin [Lentisphaerae bacterium]|nr:type II toxin-antitoxin system RelE/ParE family toxin [Lentisphaerota bacterium]
MRNGHYRVLYEIEDNRLIISVVKIGQRKDVYGD